MVLTLGFSIENGGRDAFIDEVYLLPEQRGGRGDEVMAFVEAAARSLGVRNLYLEVVAGNDRATALYGKRGFVDLEAGRRMMQLRIA